VHVVARLAIVALTAMVLAATSAARTAPASAGASWSKARAESRILAAPPRRWVERKWNVVLANCDGLGKAVRASAAAVPSYRNFSCEITVVHPPAPCASSGIYACVAEYESRAEERTLHVLDATRYALYRTG
jgi:hypothetical protein